MGVGTPISLEKYLHTTYRPDCRESLRLDASTELRTRVSPSRVRIPDVVVYELPIPEEEVFTSPPYLCIEVMSPEDTISAMQDRIDDFLHCGVPNVWVIDPWKHRGWTITAGGWATAMSGIMRTADGRIELRLSDVLLP